MRIFHGLSCSAALPEGSQATGVGWMLEKLRDLAGVPVRVHTGYRGPEHNRKMGGVPHSEHMEGAAADISLPGVSRQRADELGLEVSQWAGGGIGVYDGGFLRVDVRERSARWAG